MHRANADQQEQSMAPARPVIPWHTSVFWEKRWPGGLDCNGLWVCDPGITGTGTMPGCPQWVGCYKKACLRRWGRLFHSFLSCWLVRWLPSWLKNCCGCSCWSKTKSILIPLQHLTDVAVPKQWAQISDQSQSLTLALAGCGQCLLGCW